MSYGGTESYAVNTGQVAIYHDVASVVSSLTFGTPAVETAPTAGYSSGFFAIPAAGDPPAAAYAAGTWVSTTVAPGQSYANFEVGFVLNNGTYILADCNTTSGSMVGGAILLCVSGAHHESFSGGGWTTPIPTNSRMALALVGNVASVWAYIAGSGVWTQLCSTNVGAYYDFTAPGALVGWRPFIGQSSSPNSSAQYFLGLQWGPYSQLQGTGFYPPTGVGGAILAGPEVQLSWNPALPFPGNPLTIPVGYNVYRNGTLLANVTTTGVTNFIDSTVTAGVSYTYTVTAANADLSDASGQSLPVTLSTSPVFVYGRYVGAPVFKAFEITNTKGIEPRVWRPKSNNTIKAK
jgi:hypothetical protein